MEQLAAGLLQVSVWILPIIFAVTLHEAAHGFVASLFGDNTAKFLGRMSLNPVRHIDPFGTILLPLILLLSGTPALFGYAKPVPVDFRKLHHPKRDMVWVALAGPGTNLALALLSCLIAYAVPVLPHLMRDWTSINLYNSLQINVVLAVFNMLPLPPLDGGRVMVGLLPHRLAIPLARLERYGLLIILGALFLLPMLGPRLGLNLNIFTWLVSRPALWLIDGLQTMTGVRWG